MKYSTTTCPCCEVRWNVVPESRGRVKSGALCDCPVEGPAVVAVVLLEGVLRLAARTTAMNPTRSASVTASTAMRANSLRRRKRRVDRDAIGFRGCAGVAPPVARGRLRNADGDEWAMGVSFLSSRPAARCPDQVPRSGLIAHTRCVLLFPSPSRQHKRHPTRVAWPGGLSLSETPRQARTLIFPPPEAVAWSTGRVFARG